MTNRQWLESLSDKELARELGDCYICDRVDDCKSETVKCTDCEVAWLQAEHEEENDGNTNLNL